jgi:hypothetical protein
LPQAAALVPGMQTPFRQQPFAQVAPSQVCFVWQAPCAQLCAAVHIAHAIPPLPQAESELPATHAPPEQQPGQLVGPHGIASQLPFGHCSPDLHWAHSAPPLPHSAALVPGMQLPL